MIRRLKVGLATEGNITIPVGEMLRSESGVIYFQFHPDFLRGRRSLSPFKLKAIPEPQTPPATEAHLFDNLFGVFADSLPDGWGLLMMNRAMKKVGLDFMSSSALDRLSFVGNRGMGALVYEPAKEHQYQIEGALDLARLAAEADQVLEGSSVEVLSELMILGGSPGGARPKILVGVEKDVDAEKARLISGIDQLPENYEHWIIKFNGLGERLDAGIVEFIYSLTAAKVGLAMPASNLFADRRGRQWFGVKRFDRGPEKKRVHMHSVAGLVHANFRLPALDYEDLLKITSALTRREDDLLAMFRLATFNVVFHNRDDHAKNFAFLMSEVGEWRLAPAFDLTWSPGSGGEHSTAVLGEGREPKISHLLELAQKRGIKKSIAQEIVEQVEDGKSFLLDMFRQHQIKSHPVSQVLRAKRRS